MEYTGLLVIQEYVYFLLFLPPEFAETVYLFLALVCFRWLPKWSRTIQTTGTLGSLRPQAVNNPFEII